jgi:hypothetical protein
LFLIGEFAASLRNPNKKSQIQIKNYVFQIVIFFFSF